MLKVSNTYYRHPQQQNYMNELLILIEMPELLGLTTLGGSFRDKSSCLKYKLPILIYLGRISEVTSKFCLINENIHFKYQNDISIWFMIRNIIEHYERTKPTAVTLTTISFAWTTTAPAIVASTNPCATVRELGIDLMRKTRIEIESWFDLSEHYFRDLEFWGLGISIL